MEQTIKDRYNNTILKEAMHRFGIAKEDVHLLDGFESFIYEFQREGKEYILRIGHSNRRNVNLIRGEVDWINYLADRGAPAARAINSEKAELVELLDDGHGGHFLATAFLKAPGGPPETSVWTPAFYEAYGEALGKMHALTKNYQPTDPAWRRPHWDDPLMLEVDCLPPSEAVAIERFETLIAYLQALPREADSYGLVHFDAHGGNFFVDESAGITFFDFDDCNYTWFINDIAIVLFYSVMWEKDMPSATRSFLSSFLTGYRRQNQLDPSWLKEVPHFLKLREIDLYAIIHRSFDLDNLDDPWVAGFMRGRKERIDNGIPYVDFDFSVLAEFWG